MGIVRKFRFAKEHNANHPDPGGPSCRGQHIEYVDWYTRNLKQDFHLLQTRHLAHSTRFWRRFWLTGLTILSKVFLISKFSSKHFAHLWKLVAFLLKTLIKPCFSQSYSGCVSHRHHHSQLLKAWPTKSDGGQDGAFWPSSFFACLWTEMESRSINWPISSLLTEWGDTAGSPKRVG